MLAGELFLDARPQAVQGRLGDVAQRRGGGPGRQVAAQALHADLELAVVGPAAAVVQHVLEIPGPVEHAVELTRQRLGRRRRIEEVGGKDAVQDRGPAAQVRRQTGRLAHDLGHQVEQMGIGIEHGEKLHPGRQPGKELVEFQERLVGLGGAGKGLEQRREEFRQQLSRAGAAHGAVAPVVPAAYRGVDGLRVLIPQAPDGLDRVGVRLAAGEHQIAGDQALGAEGGRVLEQVRIMGFDPPEVRQQVRSERLRIGISEERRQVPQSGLVGGQGVGLLVVHHLQPVLDLAQVAVNGDQVVRGLRRDAGLCGQGAQGIDGGDAAQFRLAAAPDELLGLDEELDLADSPAAELDVVPGQRDGAAAPVGVDLALDRVDVLDGGEIQVLAPDERRQPFEEGGPGLAVAGHRARLDHGGAFPVLTQAFIIGFRGQRGQGERRRPGVGAQPQVGPEDIPVGRALIHQAHETSGQAHEMVVQFLGPVGSDAFIVVQHDEVDIAGIVELPRAQLAHAEDHQSRTLFGVVGIGQGEGARGGGGAQQVPRGAAERELGEIGKRARDLLEGPGAGDVGHRHREGHPPLGDPQIAGQPVAVETVVAGASQSAHHPGAGGVGALGQNLAQEPGILHRRERKVGAVAEYRFQQAAAVGVPGDGFGEAGEAGIAGLGDGLAPALQP